MSLTRTEELWTRYLENRGLSAEEERELFRSLEMDPALRDRLLGDKEFDGLLDAIHSTDRDEEAFVSAFFDRLSVERDGTRFVTRVEQTIRDVRAPRRRRGTSHRGVSPWVPAVAAAGLFAALVLLVVAVGSNPRPAPKTVKGPAPVPETPEAPHAPQHRLVIERPRDLPPVPPPPEEPRPKPPEPAPKPIEVPLPTRAPAPKETPPPTRVEAAAVAKLDRAEGEVTSGGRKVVAGAEIVAALETGPSGAASLVFRDGTRLDLAAETAVQELADAPKKILLSHGALGAEAPRQPAGQPMTIRTPHAEARVLGTTFRIIVDASSTTLEVKSGRVRLTRLSDGKSLEVSGGHGASTADWAVKSLAPKPRPVYLSENFEDPRIVEAKWKAAAGGTAPKTPGRLEIDLSSRASEGWTGGGLQTKQTFAAPLAVAADVDLSVLHEGVVAAIVFIPQGQKRGGEGVFRLQLRDRRYAMFSESGEPRELAGADRAGGAPCRERWRVELQGGAVRFLVQEREIFRHAMDLASGYTVGLDASARADAPAGIKANFDSVVIEPLKP